MKYTLNIGCDVPGRATPLKPVDVVRAVACHFPDSALNHFVAQSATEKTCIINIALRDDNEIEATLYALAVFLGQDCIAIRDALGVGKLIGPKATEWGDFNPDYFLTGDEK